MVEGVELEEAIQRIVETLVREYQPEKVILFGSYARGDAGPDSDVDLLVIKDTDMRFVQRVVEVSRLLRPFRALPYRLAFDILVETPHDIRQRLETGDSFLREVHREGRVLYERAA